MRAAALLCAILFFASCRKEMAEFQTEELTSYLPLRSGKYITYRLDSTVFTNFGTSLEVRTYQEKHQIDTTFTDNLGRTSYRVFRYLRDSAGRNGWQQAGTYFVTPGKTTVEVVDNNLRVIKLVAPVVSGKKWRGNTYLPAQPLAPLYEFENDDNMKDWEFTYESINGSFPYRQAALSNVITVQQVDERTKLDTINVVNNRATIPAEATAVWLRGNATDTVVLSASAPTSGNNGLTIYNRTNSPASLNRITIPAQLGLYFQFLQGTWGYPSRVTVTNNRALLPSSANTAFLVGTATAPIEVNVSGLDTFLVKQLTVYNRSNATAFCNFAPPLNSLSIPPGFGRAFELKDGQWRSLNGIAALLDKDPYLSDLPYGSLDYSIEKYAKGIGLVFQELNMWEYQPVSGRAGFRGFGVKRTIIDHN